MPTWYPIGYHVASAAAEKSGRISSKLSNGAGEHDDRVYGDEVVPTA
jgi:hypothetical protein